MEPESSSDSAIDQIKDGVEKTLKRTKQSLKTAGKNIEKTLKNSKKAIESIKSEDIAKTIALLLLL